MEATAHNADIFKISSLALQKRLAKNILVDRKENGRRLKTSCKVCTQSDKICAHYLENMISIEKSLALWGKR